MSAAALIEQLHAHGIRLVADSNGVNLRVIGKPLTHDLRQQVLSQKAELLTYLAQKQAANEPALHDWKEQDRAYQQHVAHCPQCCNAGQGRGQRCEEGAALWRVYQAAPMPARGKRQQHAPKRQQPAKASPAAPAMPPDLARLLRAAMLACDYWGDEAAAKEAMQQDCLSIPPESRQELAAYFQRMYGGKIQ